MEVGDSISPEANSNSNNHVLSDEDVKLSFAGLASDGQQQNNKKAVHAFEQEITEENFVGDNPVVPAPVDTIEEVNTEKQQWLEQIEQERSEWEALESAHKSVTGSTKATLPITFAEALDYFLTKDMDKSNIKPTLDRTGFNAFLHFLFGPPKLHRSLVDERDSIFCIAQVQLKEGEQIHENILQTIYKRLTGSKFDCPRRGSHWQDIGFQGNDPATDLRGVGFLGLMHILYAINDINAPEYNLFMDFFRLSLHEEQNYPFCVMSFNVTRIALELLREEKLNREINKAKEVIPVVNKFYMAVFNHIFNIWKTQHKTMKDSGHVMQDVQRTARKYPKQLLLALDLALAKMKESLTAQPQEVQSAVYGRKLSASVSDSTESLEEFESKILAKDLQHFSDIRLPRKDEPVTDL